MAFRRWQRPTVRVGGLHADSRAWIDAAPEPATTAAKEAADRRPARGAGTRPRADGYTSSATKTDGGF
jgi:hypothetical protein